ncbi:hypothetical protein [Levilactobacillus tujiorum]|uniref:hypothetical protein n=1 Tax=Levilactobacillus tujiorum TaxID=2912243 RepID=UPI00145779E2|nr:hypothetical protein [Levilactobacillus tujiorum]NLR31624.1 hypothetical protein [Levilactobacillus tujiorum]
MKLNWINKATTILLSSVLVGGVVTTTVPMFATQADAYSAYNNEDEPISYRVFKDDENSVKQIVKKASPKVKQQLNAAFFKRMEKSPVNAYGYGADFSEVMHVLGTHAVSELGRKGQVTSVFKQDYRAMVAVYDHFKGRLDTEYQSVVNDDIDAADQQISKNNVDPDSISDIADYFIQYFETNIRPAKVTGIPKVKSKITKLTAKKTASKKYVKVAGTVKLGKKANYARIKTYKGTRYAKLKGSHRFNKKIYAPKAKRVTATVGYYTHGHFSKVTAAKTVHVK